MQKIIHILAHNIEDFMAGRYDDFDHHTIRFMEKIQKFSRQAGENFEQELWCLTKKPKQFESLHKKGFKIRFFPVSVRLPLPLEISWPMLKAVKQQHRHCDRILWHLHSYYLIMYDLLAPLLWLKKQKFLMHFHGGGPSFRKLKSALYTIYHYGFMLGLTLKMADKVLVLNRDEQRRLKKILWVKNKKIVYLPSTIERKSVPDEGLIEKIYVGAYFKMVSSGRIEKIKNKKEIAGILKKLLDKEKNCVLEIIGLKKPDKELINLQNARPLQVILTEWLPRQSLLERLREGTLYLHFFPFNEGSPIALIEALSQGVPVLAFDREGIRDAVEPNKTGWLAKDLNDFEKKLRRAIQKPKMVIEMKKNCLEAVKQKFLDENYFPGLIETYKSLFSEQNP